MLLALVHRKLQIKIQIVKLGWYNERESARSLGRARAQSNGILLNKATHEERARGKKNAQIDPDELAKMRIA